MVVFFIAVSLTAGAFALSSGPDQPEGPPLASTIFDENATDRFTDVRGVNGTRHTTITREGETKRTVAEVSLRPATGLRRIETRSGPTTTDLRVSNGTVLWLYERESSTATRIPVGPGQSSTNRYRRVQQLLAELAGTFDDSGDTTRVRFGPGLSPFSLGDQPRGRTDGPSDASATALTVSYNGTTSVAGRQTYVLTLQPTTAGTVVSNYSQTLWLDSVWYYPVKRQTSWLRNGTSVTVTTGYREITFNPGIPADTFEYTPPSAARIRTFQTPDQRRYDSLAALRRAANMTVPDPDLPAGYRLAALTRTSGRVTSIGLRYTNATSTIAVAKLTPVYRPVTEGRSLTLSGTEVTYRVLGQTNSIVWSRNGTQYKITGRNVGRDVLVRVAASIV